MNEEGMWQEMLRKKYLKNKTIAQVERKKGDSHFWSGLMEVKSFLMERGSFKVQDGTQTRFWEDLWISKEPLTNRFSGLYNIVKKENAIVAQVLSTTPLNVSFRRALEGENWANWLRVVGSILTVRLNEQKDAFIWIASKDFSVKNMYNDIVMRMGFLLVVVLGKPKYP
jgi:hypothetical protein